MQRVGLRKDASTHSQKDESEEFSEGVERGREREQTGWDRGKKATKNRKTDGRENSKNQIVDK